MAQLFQGALFDSFEDFHHVLMQHAEDNVCQFRIETSRTVQTANKEITRGRLYPEHLRYASVLYLCKHSGKPRKRGEGIRRFQKSYRINCPVLVAVSANRSLGKLQVDRFQGSHSHVLSQEIKDQYPEQRRLHATEQVEARKLLSLDIAPYPVSEYFACMTGKKVTARDVRNLRAQGVPKDQELADVLNSILVRDPEAEVQLTVTTDHKINTVYIQTSEMAEYYARFPELLIMDTTYHVNVKNMHVSTMMVVDGSGHGRVVAHYIMTSENTEGYQDFLYTFKKGNPNTKDLTTVLVDKDMRELAAIRNVFPDVHVHLCLWHVLRAVRRNLMPHTRDAGHIDAVMEKVSQVVYSRTEEKFEKNLQALYSQTSDIPDFTEYFKKNWVLCKPDWCLFQRLEVSFFGQTTSNTLESFHQKLKARLSKKSSLPKCLKELDRFSQQKRKEDTEKGHLRMVQTTYDLRNDSPLADHLLNNLTVPAAEAILRQHATYKKDEKNGTVIDIDGEIEVELGERLYHLQLTERGMECSCTFFKTHKLMCCHAFHVLASEEEVGNLPPLAWIRPRYRLAEEPIQTAGCSPEPTSSTSAQKKVHKVPPTPDLKLAGAQAVTREIAGLISVSSHPDYQNRVTLLKSLKEAWMEGRDVKLDVAGESTYQSPSETADWSETSNPGVHCKPPEASAVEKQKYSVDDDSSSSSVSEISEKKSQRKKKNKRKTPPSETSDSHMCVSSEDEVRFKKPKTNSRPESQSESRPGKYPAHRLSHSYRKKKAQAQAGQSDEFLCNKSFHRGVKITDPDGERVPEDYMFSTPPDATKQPPDKKRKTSKKKPECKPEIDATESKIYQCLSEIPPASLPEVFRQLSAIQPVPLSDPALDDDSYINDRFNSMTILVERSSEGRQLRQGAEIVDQFLSDSAVALNDVDKHRMKIVAFYSNLNSIPFTEGMMSLHPVPYDSSVRIINNFPRVLSSTKTDRYKVDRISMTVDELNCLRGNNWLYDNIVSAFLHLTELDANRQAPDLVKMLLPQAAIAWSKANWGNWLYRRVRLSSFEFVMLPICENYHWTLLVAHVPTQTISFMDSLDGGVATTRRNYYFGLWNSFVKRRGEVHPELPVSGWTLNNVRSSQQNDGNSCGVFVLMNACALLKRISPCVVRQQHVPYMRRHVARYVTQNMVAHETV